MTYIETKVAAFIKSGCPETKYVSRFGFICGDRVRPSFCLIPECFEIHEFHSQCTMKTDYSRIGTVIEVPEPNLDEVIIVWDDDVDNETKRQTKTFWWSDAELVKAS